VVIDPRKPRQHRKKVFQVAGLDAPTHRSEGDIQTETLLQVFVRASPLLVTIGACHGSQWLPPQASGDGAGNKPPTRK